MPKKVTTPWEIAKPILEKMYLDGEVTDAMPRGKVHKIRTEFERVPIGNFGANWLRMKKTIGSMKQWATRDSQYLEHDKLLYPTDMTDRWDGSLAQA